MTRRLLWILTVSALCVISLCAAGPREANAQVGFPHERHVGLFPVCSGCHAGVETGQPETVYPSPTACAGCHDGRIMPAVAWQGAGPRASNLAFSHTAHRERAGAQAQTATCQTCHGIPGRSETMAVGAPVQASCRGCHAHEAPSHLADEARCTDCHTTLVAAGALTTQTIADFPRPAAHEASDFIRRHGDAAAQRASAQCAVCHAQESCARCHVNAGSLGPIQSLGPDPRVAMLVRDRRPAYPLPADHQLGGWNVWHVRSAEEDSGRCGNCHTRPTCEVCHAAVDSDSRIATLPVLPPQDPRGVRLAPRTVPGHVPAFAKEHGAAAAANQPRCSTCHAESFCTSCHESATAPGSPRKRTFAWGRAPGFHLPNFMTRHGSEAFGRTSDCASCHNTEAFCRQCHADVGIGSTGRTVAFHDAQPLWILAHGQAARQGLESCASCHAQTSCMRCHSSVGGWGVSPHGPRFDASRVAERNRLTCRLCHATDPLNRE